MKGHHAFCRTKWNQTFYTVSISHFALCNANGLAEEAFSSWLKMEIWRSHCSQATLFLSYTAPRWTSPKEVRGKWAQTVEAKVVFPGLCLKASGSEKQLTKQKLGREGLGPRHMCLSHPDAAAERHRNGNKHPSVRSSVPAPMWPNLWTLTSDPAEQATAAWTKNIPWWK